jgi:enterochelin esterase-like enzyme
MSDAVDINARPNELALMLFFCAGASAITRGSGRQSALDFQRFEKCGTVRDVIGRRLFLGSLASLGLARTSCTSCSRNERGAGAAEGPPLAPPAPPREDTMPDMPDRAEIDGAVPLPRGQVGTQTWTFDGDGRAVVIVPSWTKPDEKLPVLIALHGRGEANKGPVEGVMGWPRDYALLRAIERVCAPPLTSADFEGFVEQKRLAEVNASLEAQPFKGLVIVCPYLPDVDLHKAAAPVKEYARYLLESVMPRVRAELPVLASPSALGIDGVSLGGAVALRVGLGNPTAFGAVGSLQAALGEDQVSEITELARSARARNPSLALRLLTSKDDYFHSAITHTSQAWKAAGIAHDFADVPGPHDYPFNRGPGAIEMLLWHDRKLARG